jgi:hypothetical protein
MFKYIALPLFVVMFSAAGFGQVMTGVSGPKSTPEKPVAAGSSAPIEIAKLAVAAHGGDKLKQMRSLVLKGSVEVTAGSPFSIPATFALVISGDKYYFELTNPIQPFKQVFDGTRTYSAGFELPPMTSLGFPLLPRVGDSGYVVSALPEAKKKKHGFRITTPDGFYTDFYTDEKTNRIKSYESAYDMGGRIATTSVEVDESQMVDGVLIPKRYSQRFDLGPTSAYADFKTKEILVNTPVPDAYFIWK